MLNASTIIGRPSKKNEKKEVDRVVVMLFLSLSLSLSRGLRLAEKVACARDGGNSQNGNANRKYVINNYKSVRCLSVSACLRLSAPHFCRFGVNVLFDYL